MSLAERAQAQPRPTLKAKVAAYDPATSRYTGQRSANDPWLTTIMDSGRQFWASRGVTLPDQIALDVADDLRDSDADSFDVGGRAWNPQEHGQARVALDAKIVGQALAAARSRRRPTRERRTALKELAAILLHEMGHTGGVDHVEGDEPGFMGPKRQGDLVPQETARVIRRLVKRRPGERPARGEYGVG
jgi:hypothetical protein